MAQVLYGINIVYVYLQIYTYIYICIEYYYYYYYYYYLILAVRWCDVFTVVQYIAWYPLHDIKVQYIIFCYFLCSHFKTAVDTSMFQTSVPKPWNISGVIPTMWVPVMGIAGSFYNILCHENQWKLLLVHRGLAMPGNALKCVQSHASQPGSGPSFSQQSDPLIRFLGPYREVMLGRMGSIYSFQPPDKNGILVRLFFAINDWQIEPYVLYLFHPHHGINS